MTLFRSTHGARERGATTVEYALIVALIAVVLLSVVGFMEDRGTDELEQADQRIGVIEDNAAYQPPSGSSGPGDPEPPPSGGGTMAAPAFTPQPATDGGSKWNAFATITITDTDGTAVSGVAVEFQWSSGTGPKSGSCVTNDSGQCFIQQTVNDNDPAVTVTIDEMTKTSWVAPVLPVTSGPIGCSPPLSAACD